MRIVRAAFSFFAGDPANVRLSSALDGGALMDVGCYCVSAARLLAGEPERVGAEQAIGGDGVDVAFAGTMRFHDDVIAHFDAGLALTARDELEVVGETGSLFLDDPWHCRSPLIELRRDDGVERIELEPIDSYRLEAENLSAAIRGDAQPLLGREDAIGQARAIEALYAAADSGRTVELQLAARQVAVLAFGEASMVDDPRSRSACVSIFTAAGSARAASVAVDPSWLRARHATAGRPNDRLAIRAVPRKKRTAWRRRAVHNVGSSASAIA